MSRLILIITWLVIAPFSYMVRGEGAAPASYLNEVKEELKKEWPKNRTINLVFHGHSVPAGYFKTPVVNTLEAYPYQVLKQLKAEYLHAVVNIINTSIGGEDSQKGAARFETEVLVHRPDVLFIDYALNDRRIGLAEAEKYWREMIGKALQKSVKVILLTPSPDQRVNLEDSKNELEAHSLQIRRLAEEFGVGVVDSYAVFLEKHKTGEKISTYMSQVNHPNEKGHQLIANEIMKYLR
ncbi:MAG: SGNH/GDSL hydrolase family protein [Runella zeae]